MSREQTAPGTGATIVGVDGSGGSRDALALGQALVEPDGRLLLVYVHPFRELASLLENGHYERLVREAAEAVAAQAHELLDPRTRRHLRIVGGRSAAAVLQQLAVEAGASMIVVGSSERSSVGRVLAGSVAEALLSGAPVPVAVAPGGYAAARRPPTRMIGCAFDGSAEAAVALQCATQLAGRLAAHVQIIGVHQPLSFGNVSVSGPFGYQAANDALRVSLNNALDEARLGVDPSAEATTLLLDGPVAATLIAHSARLDLLVTGSRGYGPVRRVFAGSVSRALVRDASCPVIVVPRPETDDASPSRRRSSVDATAAKGHKRLAHEGVKGGALRDSMP